MTPEQLFQKDLIRRLKTHGLEVIELSDLAHTDGKPDILILSNSNYMALELKEEHRRRDFMLKTLFTEKQLPYHYDFLKSHEWESYAAIKLSKGFQVVKMSRKLIKDILAGLKFSELTSKWYNDEYFFTNKADFVNFIVERIATT